MKDLTTLCSMKLYQDVATTLEQLLHTQSERMNLRTLNRKSFDIKLQAS
jgi:hypothetical protein